MKFNYLALVSPKTAGISYKNLLNTIQKVYQNKISAVEECLFNYLSAIFLFFFYIIIEQEKSNTKNK